MSLLKLHLKKAIPRQNIGTYSHSRSVHNSRHLQQTTIAEAVVEIFKMVPLFGTFHYVNQEARRCT